LTDFFFGAARFAALRGAAFFGVATFRFAFFVALLHSSGLLGSRLPRHP
jgi:hypothetical protein